MKVRAVTILTLLWCFGGSVFGQNLEGTWQGTLTTPAAQLRLVFKIAKAADGKFTGQGYSIDQTDQPMAMSAISVDGRTVKLKVDSVGASFEGAFTTDG